MSRTTLSLASAGPGEVLVASAGAGFNEELFFRLGLYSLFAFGGYVYFNPALCGRRRPRSPALGFDPICALVSDRDVARAVSAAVHSDRSGVFNISGTEAVPLSALTRSTRRFTPPESSRRPQWLRRAIRLMPEKPDLRMSQDSRLRYGFTLDTRAAERELGFRATDLICLDRGGDGALSLEAVPA